MIHYMSKLVKFLKTDEISFFFFLNCIPSALVVYGETLNRMWFWEMDLYKSNTLPIALYLPITGWEHSRILIRIRPFVGRLRFTIFLSLTSIGRMTEKWDLSDGEKLHTTMKVALLNEKKGDDVKAYKISFAFIILDESANQWFADSLWRFFDGLFGGWITSTGTFVKQ